MLFNNKTHKSFAFLSTHSGFTVYGEGRALSFTRVVQIIGKRGNLTFPKNDK